MRYKNLLSVFLKKAVPSLPTMGRSSEEDASTAVRLGEAPTAFEKLLSESFPQNSSLSVSAVDHDPST